MADGGRAETQEEMIDRAARILAAAFAPGSPWISQVNYDRLTRESSGDLACPRELIVAEREERKGRRKVLVNTLRDATGRLSSAAFGSGDTTSSLPTPFTTPSGTR